MVVPHAPGGVAPCTDVTETARGRGAPGSEFLSGGESMPDRPVAQSSPRTRPDWRGWIALAWVFVWGWAYAVMAIQARAPQVLTWYRSSTIRR
jgi:hypothetical protein